MIGYGKHVMYPATTAFLLGFWGCLGPGGVLGTDVDEDLVLVGTISVAVTTFGAAPDTDGYVTSLDEGRVQPIGTNGTATFAGVPAGTYGVRLDGYAANCIVTTPNPTFVTLLPDSTLTTDFAVDCP